MSPSCPCLPHAMASSSLFAQPWADVFRGSAMADKLSLVCHLVGTIQLLEEREEMLLE